MSPRTAPCETASPLKSPSPNQAALLSLPLSARAGVWPLLGVATLMLVYGVLSHWLMLHAADRPWAVAALFGPLIVAMAFWAWRRRHGWTLAGCAALVALLVGVVSQGGVDSVARLALAQHLGIHLFLGWSFALTLRRGSTALISVLAAHVHKHWSPELAAYTRRLTAVWMAYFFVMALLSVLLYAWAPWSWWSLFANLLTPVAAAALFLGEYLLRYRWHPEFERATLVDALRAYQQMSARTAVDGAPPSPPKSAPPTR